MQSHHPRSFLAELRRRRVVRVAVVYCASAFAVLQLADILVPALHLPPVDGHADRGYNESAMMTSTRQALLAELKRPEVVRIAVVYGAAASVR